MSVYATLARFIRDSTAAGRALLTAATAGDQRTALGLGTAAQSASTDFAAASHAHGNITNAGAIGSTANLPLITTASGVITVGAFGSTANTFCQGDDSRLSDARTPTAHNQAWSTITSTPTTLAGYAITDAITSAEVASGYLALSGGTLTGPITGTGDRVEVRNGTTAQSFDVAGTWTSSTNFESLRIKATGTAFQIGSAVGSAAGVVEPVQIGTWNAAGTFTSVFRVSTTGLAFIDTRIGDWVIFGSSYQFRAGGGNEVNCGSNVPLNWSSSTDARGTKDTGIGRNAAGIVEVNNGTLGTLRDLIFRSSVVTGSTVITWQTYTPTGGGTATLLLGSTGSNTHSVTRPTSGNITIAFSGDTSNQVFLLVLQTSGSGTPGTVTWPAGLTWLTNAGSAPTLSTGNSKTDSVIFMRTGASTYLAWHTGQN